MLTEKYPYHPIPGGFAITNGKADYVRPLYAPHCNDVLNGKRYIYYVGDRPKLVLSNAAAGSTNKLLARHGHLFLGLRGGKWLHDMDEITARYVYGHEEYDIRDVSFDGMIKLTFTRTPALDAMLIRAELPQSVAGRLLFFVAGQNGKPGCQPRGGDSDNLNFQVVDTTGNQVTMAGNIYAIRRNGADLCGAVSCEVSWYLANAAALGDDPDALLQSTGSSTPAAVGVQRDTAQTVYLMLTTEPADNVYVQDFYAQAAQLFTDGLAHYKALAQTIQVETPEPYFDSAVAAQLVALDASWDAGIMHGPIAWHSGQSGWRGMYGFVTAGWGERVKENVRLYMKTQHDDGRIECYPDGDQRYNMGETLVDELLTYWLYSGDTEFFAEGGYDFVAKFLHHQDAQLRVPGTDLYENFLNAWNTDNKWTNGGPGTIACTYVWHACTIMAELAKALGKTDDATMYAEKAEKIHTAMKTDLWDAERGLYGEYHDRFGLRRLHSAPDLSSVYTPIDLGVADEMESCQALHYTDTDIESIEKDGCEFKYSSNWLPRFYSTCGLYPEEVLNNAQAWFRAGWKERGYKQYMACVLPMVNGRAAGPGCSSHMMNEKLENTGHLDFADTTGQHIRTAVEGIFGITMLRPLGKVKIMPGLPDAWNHASIKTEYIGYTYRREKLADCFAVTLPEPLAVEFAIPARYAKIKAVTVNGKSISFHVDRFVRFTAPAAERAEVYITYEESATAAVAGAETADVGTPYTLTSNGMILRILDPQRVLAEVSPLPAEKVTVTLGTKAGARTLFAEVCKDDMTAMLPVYVNITDAAAASCRQTGSVADIPAGEQYTTISLDGIVNQNLRLLHTNSYDSTVGKDAHFVLPRFPFSHDTPRSITATGRSWWEDYSRGKNGVPDTLNLPENCCVYQTDIGVPFLLSAVGDDKKNAAFTSLYNQFPDSITLPIHARGDKIYFMLSVSTNGMQSHIENARITVHLADGTTEILPLTNPDNIDDWLCYQERHDSDWGSSNKCRPYAKNGYEQFFGEKAHGNILAVDLHGEKQIEEIKLETLSCEVLTGLLGVTVAKAVDHE